MNRPVRRALRRDPRLLVRLAAWSVAETAPALVVGLAVARAIDDGFAAGRPGTGFAWLAVLAAAWLVGAAGARQVVLAVAAIVEPFREDLLGHVVESALDRASAAGHGPGAAAVARSNLQVELARDAFASVITVVRSFAFTVVSVVLGLGALVPEVLVLVLPPFAAGVGLFLLSLPAMARRQREFLLADERTAGSLAAAVGALRDITACAAEDRVAASVGARVAGQAAAGRSLARVTALRTLSLAVGGRLPVLLILAGTPWLLSRGAGAGVVLGALAYVTQSLAPALGNLVQGLGISGVRLRVSLDRILRPDVPTGPASPALPAASPALPAAASGRPALSTGPLVSASGSQALSAGPQPPSPERPVPSPGPAAPPYGPAAGRVAARNVHAELREVAFAYGPHAEPVISGLDLSIPEGDHLAVVGPSGIGKSTLGALLAGVLRPGAGRVEVGGVPADLLDPACRVLIPQEAYVFRGTLWDNLTYLAPASREEVDAAAREVGLTALAERLGGYDAEVSSGALSPAERQLVALTRAHLSPACLVILDEATCHLDPAAEARAEEAFARRGGTLVVIAHRLTSATRARRILVMDGTSVRLGGHAELLAASPLYADLVGHWNPATPQEPVL
ncbi:ATP-binding cassette domain-containing protein [Streptosporangium pseudovulgare]|uniref:ABC transporter ATP-binding protein n=1 Tax=Streptosporangium pseudovulgare TaxID=35765 RepID=A0ABQ2QK56_9ACTN|nr:ABC transporter ATP-binding protein [Streptosporangium pseudovulgare]GGP82249.1 ABC transporter ATP-binding protein [Streptosporangium pseudovulgare]